MRARGWRAAWLACLLCACGGRVSGPESNNASGGPTTSGLAPTGTASPTSASPTAVSCAGTETTGPRTLRRLARFEYDNSIEDLFGLQAHATESFAADTVVNGFDDNAAALVVTPLLGDQLYTTAEKLAEQAVQNLARFAPCAANNPDADCAQSLIRSLGRRMFRRALTDAEVTRYTDLHAVGGQDGGFAAGVQLVLTALLQSPNFLYRTELGSSLDGTSFALDQHELATELAYTLTGSTPDDALLEAADHDGLTTTEQLDAQARRLIGSPRGHQQLVHFVSEWLELDRLASVPKDAQIFPEFSADIRASMAGEAQRFVEQIAFQGDGTLQGLLNAPLSFVDDALAGFYAVEKPSVRDADGFGAVQMPDPQRHGLLGLGAVLATHARPDSSSPVQRGKLVRERVLCQPLAPPPPGIVVQPPPVDPKLSVRERYAAHSQKEPCQDCHHLIDPIGFGFENFDGVGRYRARDADRPVDATGQIEGSLSTDAPFDGEAELARLLSQSDEVARCFALQWFRFANGLAENEALGCALAQTQQTFLQAGGQISELLVATTRTAHFRNRTGGPGDSSTPIAMPQAGQSPPKSEPQQPTGMPAATDPVVVSVHTDSSWATGHCDSVTVRNDGNAALDWSVQLMIDGKLNNHWNATTDKDSGLVTFTGADWNRSVKPGESAQFGYCVALGGS